MKETSEQWLSAAEDAQRFYRFAQSLHDQIKWILEAGH